LSELSGLASSTSASEFLALDVDSFSLLPNMFPPQLLSLRLRQNAVVSIDIQSPSFTVEHSRISVHRFGGGGFVEAGGYSVTVSEAETTTNLLS